MSDIYVCGYSDLYQGKVQARFFNDAPTDAKQTLFPEAKGSLRENVGYDGVYSKIEQKAGKNREGVELGITILNSRINKLVGKSKTAKDFVKTEAEFFLIAIQMVSEAARFKYVENEIKDGPSTPDQKAICLEGMWGKISEAIKGADPKTAQIPTALSDKLALCQSDGISWKAKHGFPFFESEDDDKFILSKFDFGKLNKEPLHPSAKLLPPYWALLCSCFSNTKVESYAYDVGIPEIIQFVFYTYHPRGDSYWNCFIPSCSRFNGSFEGVTLGELQDLTECKS
ncbi:hypothetical protein Cgig2_015514 [Carnegiea gigantea]|uniref:rRNA N-glycosylase n=1 Tax=Carnegiea gigantea TaxID=171969 RepID=A0A9Q1KG15_9CARY|nr:hypothetical protein Cgig2_015514 [Carnegiea gigantea]